MDTHYTPEYTQEDRIYTPEFIIAEGLRFLNGAEFPKRHAWIRGTFTSPYRPQNAKTAYAELAGKLPDHSIRLYFSDYEGNMDKFSCLVPGTEYEMTGRLSFYNNKGNICIQLVPETVVVAKADSLETIKKMADEFSAMKSALYNRRRQKIKDIKDLVREKMIAEKNCTVLLLRPKKTTAEGDIIAALSEACDFFHIKATPCDFTNPTEIAGIIRNANNAIADIIVLSRGGGLNIDIVDSKEVIEALGEVRKPLITGLGHEENHLMAELFADCICTTPSSVGYWLRDVYREIKQELHTIPEPVKEETDVKTRNRYADTKYARYLQPEPTFYGIRWTDKAPFKWLVWLVLLIGVFQLISWFW